MKLFILVFITAFLSSLSQSITGFGFAIIMMSLLTLFVSTEISVMLALIFGCIMSASLFWKYRKSLNIRLILFPALFSAIGAGIGLFIETQTSPTLYITLFGILLIGLSLWFLFFAKHAHIKANQLTGAGIGVIAGILGAMFSISGPPLVMYFNAVTEKKAKYMSALQFCLAVLSLIAIIGRILIGKWPQQIEIYLLPCTFGVICGAIPGFWIHQKVDDIRLKRIIYIMMCIAGINFVLTA